LITQLRDKAAVQQLPQVIEALEAMLCIDAWLMPQILATTRACMRFHLIITEDCKTCILVSKDNVWTFLNFYEILYVIDDIECVRDSRKERGPEALLIAAAELPDCCDQKPHK
jgi:hypothetical protein